MRPTCVVMTAIALAGGACGGGAGDDGDDAPGDAGGPCLTATSPRPVAPALWVGPTGLEARIIQDVDSAQTSIDLQMYLFTTDSIADRVIAAHQRGVDVRVVLDPQHVANPPVRGRLAGAGVAVRDAPASYPFSHAKYLILDGDRAVIMSNNFNYTSMSAERNYGIVDTDPTDVADLQRVFDADWAGPDLPVQPDLSCSRLVVTPINARGRLVQLIAGAQATVDVELAYLAETNVRTAIVDAHRRGVAVRALLADPADYPENLDTAALFQTQGVPVRFATAISVHAKLIIADGAAFVGSQNMSLSGLQQNREVGAVVSEPAPAGVAIAQFATDWAAATAP